MTRNISHWTPDYLWSRVKDKLHQRFHPDEPWLTPAVVRILDGYLTPGMNGLEFGSGRSTIWFAKRLGRLISVEHSQKWYRIVSKSLKKSGLTNTEYVLFVPGQKDSYAGTAGYLPDGSLDFALIDGIERGQCALLAISKLKPGGILVIDDVHRYLPSESRAPLARRIDDAPADAFWQEFQAITVDWEYTWTSNGIKDTVIFRKPPVE